VVTRWGTWLQTSFYYVDNFDKISKFIDDLKSTNNKAISNAKINQK